MLALFRFWANLTSEQDEVRFMRIRTKKHEIMISPGRLFAVGVARQTLIIYP